MRVGFLLYRVVDGQVSVGGTEGHGGGAQGAVVAGHEEGHGAGGQGAGLRGFAYPAAGGFGNYNLYVEIGEIFEDDFSTFGAD